MTNTLTNEVKLYDIESLNNRLNHNEHHIREVIEMFVTYVPVNSQKMLEASQAREWETVFLFAHKIKSSAYIVNLTPILEDLEEICRNAEKRKDLKNIIPKITYVNEIIQRCAIQMKNDFEL